MTGVQKLGFYATPPHDCNYLPGRQAVTLFADPRFRKNNRLYSALADSGFRRSGEHLYVPYCKSCSSCIPVRILVNEFVPSRRQARARRRNSDLVVRKRMAEFDPEHYELYCRYLAARHRGGGMDNPTPDTYMEFLTSSWSDTFFYEFRDANHLLAVAAVDLMQNALSAVYTFYEPDLTDRSLGRFAILVEIDEARRMGLDWLYLGYWIRQCRKMNYKNEYQPLEYFREGEWHRRCDSGA